jgi:hypothetical protein
MRNGGYDPFGSAGLQGAAMSINVPPEIVKSSTINAVFAFDFAYYRHYLGVFVVTCAHFVAYRHGRPQKL